MQTLLLALVSGLQIVAAAGAQEDAVAAPTRPSPRVLVVLDKSDADVSLVDPATGKTLQKLPVGVGPHEAATSPDGRTVVVCNYGDRRPGHTLTVIDMVGRKVVKTIDTGDHHRPHGIAFLPGGTRVAVTSETSKALCLIDVRTGRVEAAIDTGQEVSHMVALGPKGRRAYVANIGSGSISVLDLEARERVATITTGAGAEGIAVRPGGKEVWVANRAADTVSIVDTATLEVARNLDCGRFPIRVAFTPDGRHALVSCARSGEVVVFDVAKRAETRRIPMVEKLVGAAERSGRLFQGFGRSPIPIGILVRPDGRVAYIANTNADRVTLIDLTTWKVSARFETGKQPDGMTWSAY